MPLNEQTQGDVGDRLWNAYEQCRTAWEMQEPKQDISLNYALTNAWPTVVTSYSGVEQAIKLLIALRKGLTVEELVRPPRESGNRCRPFESHNLAELFDQLDSEEKRAIGSVFRTFQSLYCFIPYNTVEEFLTEISRCGGYTRWRYCLVEVEKEPPRNAPDALLALWRCLLIELKRQSKWVENRCVPLSKHILNELKYLLAQAEKNEMNEQARQQYRKSTVISFPRFDRDIQKWLGPPENHMNAYAKALHDHYSGRMLSAGAMPATIGPVLERWYESVHSRATRDKTAMSVFARRAWGESLSHATPPTGPSIEWDHSAACFQPTPWTLEPRKSTCAPPGTTVVQDDHPLRSDFRRLRKLAAKHAYSFLENQACKGCESSEPWCRIYEVRDTNSPRRTIMTLWAHCAEERSFHVCEEPSLASAPHDFQAWLLSAQYASR